MSQKPGVQDTALSVCCGCLNRVKNYKICHDQKTIFKGFQNLFEEKGNL